MLMLADHWRPSYRPLMAEPEHDPTPRAQRHAMAATIRALREAMPGEPTPGQLARKVGWTSQTWRNYEGGDKGPILSLDVQMKIARALGVTHEQLLFEYQQRLGHAPPPPAHGLGDRAAVFRLSGDSARRAVFPLDEGEAVLTYPENLSQEARDQLADYLMLFTKSLRRQAS